LFFFNFAVITIFQPEKQKVPKQFKNIPTKFWITILTSNTKVV